MRTRWAGLAAADGIRVARPVCLRARPWAACALAMLAACGAGDEYVLLQEFNVDDTAVIIEAGEDRLEDGTTAVRVRRIDDRGDVVIYESTVANADSEVTIDNLRPDLRTLSDLRLCLNGSEQADVSVRINVLVRYVASNERICTR